MYTIHLGFSGFPKGLASVQRIRLTFKGLKAAGATPLIINKISHHQYPANNKMERFDGILYVNTPYLNSKPGSFIKRNLNKLSGYFGELKLLYKKRKKIETAILYSTYFLEYPYYFFLSRIFGFKLLIQYVEMFSVIPGRSSFFTKINDRLIDRYICFFCDGVIAISDYLYRHINTLDSVKPVIKIPANSDFDEMNAISAAPKEAYLMYCGTIIYEKVIEFIISLFIQLKENKKYEGNLLLIVSGEHEENWKLLYSVIKKSRFQKNITIKSNISHTELFSYYKGADVLIIPLRDTMQDIARFPHKIGEYTAAKRPLLSTNLGELEIYFKDGVSAILADTYSIDAYYNKLSVLLSSKQALDQIGLNGHAIGLSNFDYKAQGRMLKKFIDNI